jgi:hypothetical protein
MRLLGGGRKISRVGLGVMVDVDVGAVVGVGGAGSTGTSDVSPFTVPVVVEIRQRGPSSTTHQLPETSFPTISSVVPVGRMRTTS